MSQPDNSISVAKLLNNFEITKDLAKKHCHRRTTEHVSSLTLCLSKKLIVSGTVHFQVIHQLIANLLRERCTYTVVPYQTQKTLQRYNKILRRPRIRSKKELPPVLPLGTNRRGISKAAQTILAPRPFHQEDQPTVVPGNRLHWVQMLVMNAPCIPRLNL